MSTNVYQMVTDRIIAELEKGSIPWKRPWTGVNTGAYNRISNKPYSLLNQILLGRDGEWATFKQWTDLGGHIRKGEKSSFVVFWKIQPYEDINADGEKVVKQIPLLRYYNVFHISQVDGVEPKAQKELKEVESIEAAEKIKESYKEREHIRIIETITNGAGYDPVMDYIQVPCRKQYTDANEFYSTLFHEMVHSTGHKTRLDRLTSEDNLHFGSETYSKEELCAELGSAMLLNQIGIETPQTFKNSAGYIQGWLQRLRNDNKFIVSAASKAEKAVNFILGEQ
mgnify:CR=1 FL=1|jgi:antirestriction protein ArdC